MPKIPVDECPAGPAMDAAVAKALGWGYINGSRWGGNGWCWRYPDNIIGRLYRFPPSYSTDIAAAWELWHQLAKRFFWIEICTIENLKSRAAFYHDIDPKVTNPIEAFGETAPLAICRAFLKANGVEFVEIPE